MDKTTTPPSPKTLRSRLTHLHSRFGLRVLDAIEEQDMQMQDVWPRLGFTSHSTLYRMLANVQNRSVDDLGLALSVLRIARLLALDGEELLTLFREDRARIPERTGKQLALGETRASIVTAGFPFGLRILDEIDAQQIALQALIRDTGINHQTFFKMMRGDQSLTRGLVIVEHIVRIARVLSVPPEELIALFFYDDVDMAEIAAYLYMTQAYLELPAHEREIARNMFSALWQSVLPGYPRTRLPYEEQWGQMRRRNKEAVAVGMETGEGEQEGEVMEDTPQME